jgi:hypothetical protein
MPPEVSKKDRAAVRRKAGKNEHRGEQEIEG